MTCEKNIFLLAPDDLFFSQGREGPTKYSRYLRRQEDRGVHFYRDIPNVITK